MIIFLKEKKKVLVPEITSLNENHPPPGQVVLITRLSFGLLKKESFICIYVWCGIHM